MANWMRSRMAADYVDDAIAAAASRSAIIVDGYAIGNETEPVDELDALWGLPAEYFKQFASASPVARIGYDPARDLPQSRIRGAHTVCDDRGCAKCNRVTDATLQRERKIVLGGSSSGGRTRKKVVAIVPEIDVEHVQGYTPELPDTRFSITGFTRGLCEHYAYRQLEARAVLRDVVAYVTVHGRFPEGYARAAFPLPPKPQRRTYEVRGLSEDQKRLFSAFPGIARIALIHDAMKNGKDRILSRDGLKIWQLVA